MSKLEHSWSRFAQGIDHHGSTNYNAKIVNRFLEMQAYFSLGALDQLDRFIDFMPSKLEYLCAPEFYLVGACMREAYATRPGSVHLPGGARWTHVRRSRHLPFYDPKVEGRQVTLV
ncbi:hypothetical protein CRG98_029270 [Punica granatum]|uniref:Uncharacterized protein n=1 Tax=Punica granatum TaxID=22663 RepID=A0A2I0J272_PUNGR|nr:hypothetical protein CRG98_029270 [Punica granatum]